MKTTADCPLCDEVIEVEVPLGASIWRTMDKALIEHNKEKHG
jgi:hypothetical protein